MASLITIAALGIVGCGGSTQPSHGPPGKWVDPGLDATGAAPAHALHLLPPTQLTLPESSLPPGFDAERRFELPVYKGRARKAPRYRATLPFDVGDEGRRFAPEGMKVFIDGQPIPYRVGKRRWHIEGHDLTLILPGEAPEKLEVAWGGVQDALDRHEATASGLEPAAFIRYQVTLEDITRDGLLLPAPTVAEWALQVPEASPRFEAWLALEPSPILTERSDGAKISLSVVVDGEATEVDHQRVRLRTQDPYERWQVDLSPWAGKEVTLRLATDPDGTPWFDYVFVGSPTVWGDATGEPRRVVVIGLDTTRPDHLGFYGYGRDTTPELDQVAATSVVFERAWAPAPRTRPSFRTATTGRYPLDAIGATNIAEVFQQRGFATAAWTANVHLQPRFDFHEGFDLWRYDGKARANDQVDATLAWLADHAERDTYVFMHIMDPHVFYDPPEPYRERFLTETDPALPEKPNRWQVLAMDRRKELSQTAKAQLEALYDGELAFVSHELARFFGALDAMGGRTLVVIHSDHGEEFWEHGSYEHNHALWDEVTRAVLVFRSRTGMDGTRRVDVPVTLADIAPTLYDFAGFTDTPPTDGVSLRPLIEGAASSLPARPLGVAHLRYGREQWAVVHEGFKYVLHTASGAQELYDLSADPGEKANLAGTRDTIPYQRALSQAHAMPVGPGWRLRVSAAPNGDPVVVQLPTEPLGAAIIDPERTVDNPSNQAWGEPPHRTLADIGTLTVDGQLLTWVPGPRPRDGLIHVLFPTHVNPPINLEATVDGQPLRFQRQRDDSIKGMANDHGLVVQAGVVCLPTPGEAERIAQQSGAEVGASDREMLESLGYVGGDDDDGDPHAAPSDEDTDTPQDHE